MKAKALEDRTGKAGIRPENIIKFENVYALLKEDGYLRSDIERAFRKVMAKKPTLENARTLEMYAELSNVLGNELSAKINAENSSNGTKRKKEA